MRCVHMSGVLVRVRTSYQSLVEPEGSLPDLRPDRISIPALHRQGFSPADEAKSAGVMNPRDILRSGLVDVPSPRLDLGKSVLQRQ